MKNKQSLLNIALLFIMAIGVIGFFYFQPNLIFEEIHAHEVAEEGFTRGPKRGRLLQKENFQVEVTIFEPPHVPPRFRIYFYENAQPINPKDVQFKMELERINRKEDIPFKQVKDYLQSEVEASEPHSFKVKITATYKNKTYEWEYESYEGRVELTKEAILENKIKIEVAKAVTLEIKLDVMGKIVPDEELTVHISPRFPGVVKSVNKKLGDNVRKGEILAVIESNESLQNYEVKSPINGIVIKKEINVGTYLSGQENIFVISDLLSVWADFNIYRSDLSRVKVGDPVVVTSLDGNIKTEGQITYLSPVGHEMTQSIIARAILQNKEYLWKPGLFVLGQITLESAKVAVAVKDSALQTFRDFDVVFIESHNIFEVAPVKLGRRNKEWVEIISGLNPGDSYVSENSFILKADLEKSEAAHEH